MLPANHWPDYLCTPEDCRALAVENALAAFNARPVPEARLTWNGYLELVDGGVMDLEIAALFFGARA